MRTLRQEIVDILRKKASTARDLSKMLAISEKEAYEHLKHVEKTVYKKEKFIHYPSQCLSCGFVFKKRARLIEPGKCPVCRKQSISRPLFQIVALDNHLINL